MVLEAVSGGPLVKLARGPAAELQQFFPMLLEKVEDSGDHNILRRRSSSKGVPADVDMEAAGSRLMGAVAHTDSLLENGGPGHVFFVVLQAHGMGDDLKAVLQGAVMLAVDVLRFPVGDLHKLSSIGGAFPALVDLKLNAKETRPFSEKDGLGLIVVVLDGIEPMGAAKIAEAIYTVGGFALSVLVVSVVYMEEPSTIGAVGVIALVTSLTKGCTAAAGAFAPPDTFAAMGTEGGLFLQAAGAKVLLVKTGSLGNGHFLAADFADKGSCGHGYYLLEVFCVPMILTIPGNV